MKNKVDDMINGIVDNNTLIEISPKVFIRRWHLDIIKKYDVPVASIKKLSDLVFLLDNVINTSDDLTIEEQEELNQVVSELSEINYYNYTNK